MFKRLLAMSTLLLFSVGANAGIVVALDGTSATAGGFNWTYDVTLEPDSLMSRNNYFVLYDISGVTNPVWAPNTIDPDGVVTGVPDASKWSVATLASGPVPPFLNPIDNGGLPNVLVTLADNTTIMPRSKDVAGLLLGKLTVTSPVGNEGIIDYASQAAQLSGSELRVVGGVAGPVPEPSTVGMMVAGLAAAMGFALRRRR